MCLGFLFCVLVFFKIGLEGKRKAQKDIMSCNGKNKP